ncbi:MAG: hypothetical protein GC165_18120 [Armatimonadetes bacterium]|nr:hypothetical protein [Armatimonadota bacterium]
MNPRFEGQVASLRLNAEQIHTLISSPCSEVFDALSAIEPRSAREVASDIDRSPASVGEQLAKLLDVKLIIPAGTRKRRSRTEALYVHAGMATQLFLNDLTSDGIEQYKLRFKSQMRQAERQHDAVYGAVANDPSYTDFLIYKYHTLFVDRERALRLKLAIAELQSLILELSETNADAREDGEFVRVQFTVMSLPTQQESKRRT